MVYVIDHRPTGCEGLVTAIKQWYIGVDFGLIRDHTAVVVLERTETKTPSGIAARHTIPEIRRLPLGTPYPTCCERIANLISQLPGRRVIAADATGVGRPIMDMLHGALRERWKAIKAGPGNGMPQVLACVITGGVKARGEGNVVHVPKREMILCFAGDLQDGTLTISKTCEHAELLITEMRNFRFRTTSIGNDTYEAWREGEHDDIVFAAALADWAATNYWAPILDRPVKVTARKVIGANGAATTLTLDEAWKDHQRR